MTWPEKYRGTILALIAGFVLRLYFILGHPHIMGDSLVYGNLAGNMLNQHIYGLSEGAIRSTLIRLPGYPLLLAACFAVFGIDNYTAVLYVQLVLDLATCWLIADLARRLMGERVGMYALWLGALCPFTANYVAAPLTEVPGMFCLALAFYSLQRWSSSEGERWIWPIGFSLAFAVLLRPDRALLVVAVWLAMAWIAWRAPKLLRGRRFAQLGIVTLVILLPLVAWGARNWRVFHVVQPLAPRYASDPGEFVNYGFQRWYRTWAVEFKSTDDIYWNYNGDSIGIGDLPARAFDSADQRVKTAALFDRYKELNIATPAIDASFGALAAERIATHPLRYYVELPVLRVANMWLRPRTEMLPGPMAWWAVREHPLPSIAVAAYGVLNLAYLVLAAVGLWRWKQQGWSSQCALGYALVGFVLLRSVMLLTIDNSEPRYTIDCFPVVILLAAFAFGVRSELERIP